MLTAAVFRVVHFSAGVNAFALTVNRWRFAALILLLLPIFPYGESPTNVSVVTVPVLRSRRPQHSTLPLQIFLVMLGMELQICHGADARHQCYCQDQTWSQFWSQNGMVAGVSVLPTLLAKFNGRENRISETQRSQTTNGAQVVEDSSPVRWTVWD